MIDATAITVDDTRKVAAAADRANYRNIAHAAASIRKEAIASIERIAGPSEPGQPPHTRRGLLPRAIVFAANKEEAVIGPRASIAGTAGEAHEFGGEYKGGTYPERPFMGPALTRNLDRFAREWEGSVSQ